MKEKQKKTCPWCKKEFIANHAARKYCCDSHRMQAYHKRKGYKVVTILPEQQELNQEANQEANQDQGMQGPINARSISRAGVTEATIGAGAVELTKRIFTADKDMPATKGYVMELIQQLERNNEARHQEMLAALGYNTRKPLGPQIENKNNGMF